MPPKKNQEQKSTFDFFKESLSSNFARIGEFVPGSQLAKGLGTTLALREANRFQKEAVQAQTQLDNLLKERIQGAETQEEVIRLRRLAADNFSDPNIISSAISDAPTNRQILASAAELALLSGFGYKPYLKTGVITSGTALKEAVSVVNVAKSTAQAVKLRGAGTLARVTQKVIRPLVREGVIGAAFFSVTEAAANKDATINDILKSAELGAVFGVGLPAAFIGGAAVFKRTAKFLRPKVRGAIQAVERVAIQGPLAAGETQIKKTLSVIGERPKTFQQKAAERTVSMLQSLSGFKAAFIDRFSPLQRIENDLLINKGKPLSEAEKIYRDARLLQSVADDTAARKVKKLTTDLQPFNDIKDEYTAWITQLDLLDRVKLGQKVAGNQTLKQLEEGLVRLGQEIGPDNMIRVRQARRTLHDYNVKLLDERVEAGLITATTRDTLLKTHPNYIPHNVILEIDEGLIKGISGSFNVAQTDILRATGSLKNIKDPIGATIQRTPIATRTIEKNKLLNNIVKAQEEFDFIPGMRQITDPKEKIPRNFGTINLFRNGEKEKWLVPKDLEIAIKNMDTPVTSALFEIVTFPAKILKKSATQLNLSFALPNKFRDKQTAVITSQAFIEELAKKTGVSAKEVNLSKEEITALYKESGGFGSSIFVEGEDKILQQMTKAGLNKTLPIETNPLKIIDEINQAIEQGTRLNVFKKALEQGLSPKDAAFISRDATIDFARMGSFMRPLNQAIPFLNARIQGFVNLGRAVATSPEMFARMQLYTAVYPTMAVYEHNRRYESYANISQYMKNKYWIIMTSEAEGVDPFTGQSILVPQFITIPKGEGQSLVAGPLQFYLERADAIDFRSVSEMLADTLGSATPLEFQTFDQGNIFLTAISQLGPVASVPVGLGTNVHPFFGSSIIPQAAKQALPEDQFKNTTPELIKDIAKQLNMSPAKIEFVIDSFGGLAQDVTDAIDIAYNVVRDGEVGRNSISDTPLGALTQIPLTRRFFRESTERGSEVEFRREQKGEIVEEVTSERLRVKRKAEEIWLELKKRDTPDEKLQYLNVIDAELTPAIRDVIKTLNKSRAAVEVLSKGDSVEVRARYINQRLIEMTESGFTKEERTKFLNELDVARILTKDTKRRLFELQQGQF